MNIGFLTTSGNNFAQLLTSALWVVVIFVLGYIALSFIFGSEQHRDRTKKHLPWLIIGCAIIVSSQAVISTIKWLVGG